MIPNRPSPNVTPMTNGNIRMATLLSTACWTSLLVLTWLFIADYVPLDLLNGVAWLFFLVVGFFAAVIASSKQ
jgi:hypothetical protein